MKQLYYTYIYSLKDGTNIIILHLMALAFLIPALFFFQGIKNFIMILIVLVGLSFILTVNFFRNPARKIDYKENTFYAPADGVVSSVEKVKENKYLNKEAYRIKIFMNIFNVHRNRAPISGDIDLVKYKKGKWQAAFKEVEESNEQFIISLKTKHGKVILKQIAGLIARRIICNVKSGDKIDTGKIFGMIKFGSSVITYLPINTNISVKRGDKVKAGMSELGYFAS